MSDLSSYLIIAPEIQTALAESQPVVALESTVIAHGLPYPTNLEIASALEKMIRAERAIPATIGLRGGKIVIGLSESEIHELATARSVLKVSRRDLAAALASKALGATTVSGTMLCAHLAGLRFFATGGIGGVHRGAPTTMDISADLTELGRTPVMVICAGAKSILDLPLTLEYLETQGVPVIGWQTDNLPAFFVQDSGLPLALRADESETVAAIAHAHWTCGLGGLVVACPIESAYALDYDQIETATSEAIHEAAVKGIQGAATTPFLLRKVAELTGGESIEANKALLLNNARQAARFALAYQQHQTMLTKS
jgi:pseudouridine-5'-phosphate glycosidase